MQGHLKSHKLEEEVEEEEMKIHYLWNGQRPFPILDGNMLVDIIVPSLSFSTFLGMHVGWWYQGNVGSKLCGILWPLSPSETWPYWNIQVSRQASEVFNLRENRIIMIIYIQK